MEALLVSTGLVAVAEIGDKTQLLALLLAARFRRPLPISCGILIATVANHALAGMAGAWAGSHLSGPWLGWIVGLSFLAVAVWALVPDRLEDGDPGARALRNGAFATTLACFFLAEMGDKTQAVTVLLAARFDSLVAVVMGTTLGMLMANLPVVLCGHALAARIPARAMRMAAALMFATLGGTVLLGAG